MSNFRYYNFYNRGRTSKYNSKKVIVDGIEFDSKKEGNRYKQLKEWQDLGLISDLQLQAKIELQPSFKRDGKTIRAINYIADFTYYDDEGNFIIEDVKGFETPEFKLKKKLMLYKYPNINFYINKKV